MIIPFLKMHGLGNDFVVLVKDQLPDDCFLTKTLCKALSDRKRGIGCDQIILMEGGQDDQGVYSIAFYNADGSVSGACGNGTRCIAGLIFEELAEIAQEGGSPPPDHLVIRVKGVEGQEDRLLQAWKAPQGMVTVDMGLPLLQANLIPVNSETPQSLEFLETNLPEGVAVGMGNPHCVFFIPDDQRQALAAQWGEFIEKHDLFPERTNVEFVSVLSSSQLAVTVWERGVGFTEACGTGACASVVAGVLKGYTDRAVTVTLDGGKLHVVWDEETGHVFKTGAYTWVGEGIFMFQEGESS
jgi:diaminopimelate epimerase